MLHRFRHHHRLFAAPAAGIFLAVGLLMALAPCVATAQTAMSMDGMAAHDMGDCPHCDEMMATPAMLCDNDTPGLTSSAPAEQHLAKQPVAMLPPSIASMQAGGTVGRAWYVTCQSAAPPPHASLTELFCTHHE